MYKLPLLVYNILNERETNQPNQPPQNMKATTKTPTMDILVDEAGKKIQECIVINNVCLSYDAANNIKVKCVGFGPDWRNPGYTGAPGQVEFFKSKYWVAA